MCAANVPHAVLGRAPTMCGHTWGSAVPAQLRMLCRCAETAVRLHPNGAELAGCAAHGHAFEVACGTLLVIGRGAVALLYNGMVVKLFEASAQRLIAVMQWKRCGWERPIGAETCILVYIL
eukprot:359461-Chlamydomonas_euryale.AAC.3